MISGCIVRLPAPSWADSAQGGDGREREDHYATAPGMEAFFALTIPPVLQQSTTAPLGWHQPATSGPLDTMGGMRDSSRQGQGEGSECRLRQ
jgi:hypothetical protein